jgi:hypothetical protein
MTDQRDDRQVMTRYLLGRMSPQEHAQFEERFVSDPALLEELIDTEDEMVRAYLRGDCPETEKKEFEKRYLGTPEGRQRVQFQQSLTEYVDGIPGFQQQPSLHSTPVATETPRLRSPRDSSARSASFWAWGFALASLALLTFSVWTSLTNMRLRRELAQVRSGNAGMRDHVADLSRQLADLKVRVEQAGRSDQEEVAQLKVPPEEIAPVVLTSHLERHPGGQQNLSIPPGAAAVPVWLRLDHSGFAKYSVVLETADGHLLWRENGLHSEPGPSGVRVVRLQLPRKLVDNASYVFRLSGTTSGSDEEIADYVFRVFKR